MKKQLPGSLRSRAYPRAYWYGCTVCYNLWFLQLVLEDTELVALLVY